MGGEGGEGPAAAAAAAAAGEGKVLELGLIATYESGHVASFEIDIPEKLFSVAAAAEAEARSGADASGAVKAGEVEAVETDGGGIAAAASSSEAEGKKEPSVPAAAPTVRCLWVRREAQEALLAVDVDPNCAVGGICAGSSKGIVPFHVQASSDTANRSCSKSTGGGGEWSTPSFVDTPHMGIADLRIRGDSKLFASAGWDHRVRLFQWPRPKAGRSSQKKAKKKSDQGSADVKECAPLAVLKYHTETVQAVHFGQYQGQHLLVSASVDKHIALWKVYPEMSKAKHL